MARRIRRDLDDKMAGLRRGTREGLVTMGRRTSEAAHEWFAEQR